LPHTTVKGCYPPEIPQSTVAHTRLPRGDQVDGRLQPRRTLHGHQTHAYIPFNDHTNSQHCRVCTYGKVNPTRQRVQTTGCSAAMQRPYKACSTCRTYALPTMRSSKLVLLALCLLVAVAAVASAPQDAGGHTLCERVQADTMSRDGSITLCVLAYALLVLNTCSPPTHPFTAGSAQPVCFQRPRYQHTVFALLLRMLQGMLGAAQSFPSVAPCYAACSASQPSQQPNQQPSQQPSQQLSQQPSQQ
jgi:hypothetical protein